MTSMDMNSAIFPIVGRHAGRHQQTVTMLRKRRASRAPTGGQASLQISIKSIEVQVDARHVIQFRRRATLKGGGRRTSPISDPRGIGPLVKSGDKLCELPFSPTRRSAVSACVPDQRRSAKLEAAIERGNRVGGQRSRISFTAAQGEVGIANEGQRKPAFAADQL